LLGKKVKIPPGFNKGTKVVGALEIPLPLDEECRRDKKTGKLDNCYLVCISQISDNTFGLQFKTFRGYRVHNTFALGPLQQTTLPYPTPIPVLTGPRYYHIAFLLVAEGDGKTEEDLEKELLADMARIKEEFVLKTKRYVRPSLP